MSSLKPNNDILTDAPTQGSQASQQTSIINNSNLWANIPEELKKRAQWVTADKNKTPYQCNGRKASPTDPATWTDFHTACTYAKQHDFNIGYVLSAHDPFTCIDLDIKADTPQEQLDRASRIIKTFNSYTEYSQSGKGFHIWVYGNIGKGCRRDNVEIYSQERFIICTGNTFKSEPINERSELLNNMVTQLSPLNLTSDIELVEKEEVEDDEVIVEKLMRQSNAEKFNNLCNGNWKAYSFPSQSEADLALMSMFCFYSESNEQCRRLFRMSKLGKREKAITDNKYLNSTLKLIRTRQEKEKKDTDAFIQQFNKPKLPFFMTDEDLEKLPPPSWLVDDIIPETGIGVIYGESGSYKSFLTIDLLAHIGNGRAWFGKDTKKKPVIYIALEGNAGIPKRIKAWKIHNRTNSNINNLNRDININFRDKSNIDYLGLVEN